MVPAFPPQPFLFLKELNLLLNNILYLEAGLLVTPRLLGPPLPRTDAPPQRVPVYDENRRPIPYMFRDRITGKIGYEPPTPSKTTSSKTTPSKSEDQTKSEMVLAGWIDALLSPPGCGMYRSTTESTPQTPVIYIRWYDGQQWIGPGSPYKALCVEPARVLKWEPSPKPVRWWMPLTDAQRAALEPAITFMERRT